MEGVKSHLLVGEESHAYLQTRVNYAYEQREHQRHLNACLATRPAETRASMLNSRSPVHSYPAQNPIGCPAERLRDGDSGRSAGWVVHRYADAASRLGLSLSKIIPSHP